MRGRDAETRRGTDSVGYGTPHWTVGRCRCRCCEKAVAAGISTARHPIHHPVHPRLTFNGVFTCLEWDFL